ncbi:MAG: helix-hairpin-helix domain-containing protein [Kiritimatiellae bacterium]|nr:helix-hairpin-helix domain-containing protein [Kiritimatiellia bacterium]
MSLLGNLFRDRQPKKKPAPKQERRPAAARQPEPEEALPPEPAPAAKPKQEAPSSAAPDLDTIREQLREIEEIIGAGESEPVMGEMADDVVALEMPLKDVIDVLPPNYLRPGAGETDVQQRVTVVIPDLFSQLAHGKVVTTLPRLIAEVPENLLATDIQQHMGEDISLPLPIVVAAIRPDELQKRTTTVQRDIAETDLPNLFTREGDRLVAAPVAEPAAPPAAKPKKAAPPPVEEEVPAPAEEVPAPIEVEPAEEPAAEEVVAEAPQIEEIAPEEIPVAEEAPVEEAVVEEAPAEEPVAEEVVAEAAPIEEVVPEEPVAEEAPPEEAVVEEMPAEEAVPEAVEEIVPAAAEPEPVAVEEPAVPEPVAVEPSAPAAAPAYEEVIEGSYLFLRGLDMNKATAEEMVERFDGIGPRMAQKIVEDRQVNGPFFYLLDLARVPGLGRKTFEHLTGLPLRKQIFQYLGVVGQVLGKTMDGVPDVRQVATRFKELEGFEGCVLAHEDGYVLAESWETAKSEAFGAFAPQMYKKMGQYLRRLDLGGIGSITFFLEDRPFTLVRSGEIFLVAVHAPSRFSRKHVHIVQAVGAELGRRLMRQRSVPAETPESAQEQE